MDILIDFDHTLFNVRQYLKDKNSGILRKYNLKKYLYDDVHEFIKYSKKYGNPLLFSEGKVDFQNYKIKYSGLSKLFAKNMKLYDSYAKMTNASVEFFGKKIVLIDDNPIIVYKAKRIGWKVIRIKRGKHSKEPDKIAADFTVKNLHSIVKNDLFSRIK